MTDEVSPGPRVDAVLFDTFGTVVDWRSGVAQAVAAFADRHALAVDAVAFATRWRSLYEPAMERVRRAERGYVPLDVLHAENLRLVFEEIGIDHGSFGPVELSRLNEAWHRLPPWPDSVEGLRRLARSVMVGPLSNGNLALLARMAKNAGLPWDVIVASDVVQAYKPAPQAYLRAAEVLGLEPGQVMLAAAHNDDLFAARAVGLRTAFIPRPTEHGPAQTTDLEAESDWDVVAHDILDLADRMDGSPWTAERHLEARATGTPTDGGG